MGGKGENEEEEEEEERGEFDDVRRGWRKLCFFPARALVPSPAKR